MVRHRKTRKRFDVPGQPRYVTFSCYNRLRLFQNEQIRNLFVEQLASVQSRLAFHLHAWVVMPEHVHLLLTPGKQTASMASIQLAIKRPFATQVLARWRELQAPILRQVSDRFGNPHFWQAGGGHDRNIDNVPELITKIDYTHANPIRRDLVKLAIEWKWSSARWYEGDRSYGPPIDVPIV